LESRSEEIGAIIAESNQRNAKLLFLLRYDDV
jgi:hypothetical protein